ARWLLNLQQYTFQVQHCSGKNNTNADALSRIDPDNNEDSDEIVEIYIISVQTNKALKNQKKRKSNGISFHQKIA
ncbi:14539_t:CDS:1, partial [Funneliformis caledonium]